MKDKSTSSESLQSGVRVGGETRFQTMDTEVDLVIRGSDLKFCFLFLKFMVAPGPEYF